MRLVITIIFILFISSINAQESIDVITLKKGDIIKGKIIENVINEHIKIEIQGGSIFIFKYSEIESIKIEKNPKIEKKIQ